MLFYIFIHDEPLVLGGGHEFLEIESELCNYGSFGDHLANGPSARVGHDAGGQCRARTPGAELAEFRNLATGIEHRDRCVHAQLHAEEFFRGLVPPRKKRQRQRSTETRKSKQRIWNAKGMRSL
jgi:hypothetical protein